MTDKSENYQTITYHFYNFNPRKKYLNGKGLYQNTHKIVVFWLYFRKQKYHNQLTVNVEK